MAAAARRRKAEEARRISLAHGGGGGGGGAAAFESTGRRAGGGRCPSRGLVAAARAATGLETWKRALHHVRTREHLRTPWDGVDTNNCSRILNSKAAFFFMARSRCTYPAINHRVNPLLAVN